MKKQRAVTARERELLLRCIVLMGGALFFFAMAIIRAHAGDYGGSGYYDEDDRYDVMSQDDHDLAMQLKRQVLGSRPTRYRSKASKLRDSVTIIINESTSSNMATKNDLKRDTSNNFTLTNWLSPSQHGAAVGGSTPQFAWSGSRSHKSDSKVDRSQSFTSTLTGEVINVFPNGYLTIQARKSVNVNGEIQVVTVTGTVNPEHMDANSTVKADYLMDMKVDYNGTGPMSRFNKRGWWAKAWDFLTPF